MFAYTQLNLRQKEISFETFLIYLEIGFIIDLMKKAVGFLL